MPVVFLVGTDEELEQGKGKPALTRTVAAARLGVTERTIRELVEAAQLTPAEYIGNNVLFLSEDVEELREKRRKRGF